MKKRNPWMIGGLIVLGVIVLLVLTYISIYNTLVRMNEGVNGGWANVETQYQRRVDLIPNLVSTVKGAADFEAGTLEEITRLRSQWQAAPDVNAKIETANQIESALSKLLVIAENYPQLRANENFKQLQEELSATEDKIAYSRQYYNDTILDFNNSIKVFPGKAFASLYKVKERKFIEITTEERKIVKVKF